MPNMKICRKLGMGQRHTLAQCLGCSKFIVFLHAILIDLSRFSRASLTPLGRVFKIHNIFLHYFIGFLTSINYMDKWVTPLGVR